MKQAISEVVGRADFDNHTRGVVYRALRPLMCAGCGQMIVEGALFTRRQLSGQSLRIMPRCQECAPFAVIGSSQQGEPASLIRSLLSPAPEASPEHTSKKMKALPQSAPSVDRVKLAEEVRRRLGPALARSRRTRR